jgi:voltage-gated potassium channel
MKTSRNGYRRNGNACIKPFLRETPGKSYTTFTVYTTNYMKQHQLAINNIILLNCLIIMIFFFPVLSFHRVLMKNILFTAIIFFGTFSLDFVKRAQKILIASGTITIFLVWFDHFLPSDVLDLVFSFSFFFYNLFIVVFVVRHIAKSEKANVTIIISSINGYLLIGILGAVLLAMAEILQKLIYHLDTGAINFAGGTAQGFHDFLYFSFITLTTLGYGDVTPVSALAKSLTIVIAISGQLYLTILIAMLVGKFLSSSSERS